MLRIHDEFSHCLINWQQRVLHNCREIGVTLPGFLGPFFKLLAQTFGLFISGSLLDDLARLLLGQMPYLGLGIRFVISEFVTLGLCRDNSFPSHLFSIPSLAARFLHKPFLDQGVHFCLSEDLFHLLFVFHVPFGGSHLGSVRHGFYVIRYDSRLLDDFFVVQLTLLAASRDGCLEPCERTGTRAEPVVNRTG